jgi:hypothetical protein
MSLYLSDVARHMLKTEGFIKKDDRGTLYASVFGRNHLVEPTPVGHKSMSNGVPIRIRRIVCERVLSSDFQIRKVGSNGIRIPKMIQRNKNVFTVRNFVS